MTAITPWDKPWPIEDLEFLDKCPVCNDVKRKLLFDGLVDNAFFVANGRWKMYQCESCRSAYLDPRPSETSINRAYGTYYTHKASVDVESKLSQTNLIQKIRHQLKNGYYNHHCGTNRVPFIQLGAWLLLLNPKFRKTVNAKFRYLNKPKQGQKLLDVGCGNGEYLLIASEAGWVAKGIEPDPKALETARSRGLDVLQGSIDQFLRTGELFDVITMSHVLEHVHDPVNFIQIAYKCLKPGGILYIETPNIDSFGARRFKQNWRGLEAPRHLVLLSYPSLCNILNKVGFSKLTFFSRREVRKNITLKSHRMENGRSPYDKSLKKMSLKDTLICYIPRRSSEEEFLTLVASKG